MKAHIGIDIGTAHTAAVVHVQDAAGDGGRLLAHRFGAGASTLRAGLDEALGRSGVNWADVALVACGSSVGAGAATPWPELPQALRQAAFRARVYFMQPDTRLSPTPWADGRSGPVAGMLAASVLSRLIGERLVLAVDVGATGVRCTLIRDGHLAWAQGAVAMEALGPADAPRRTAASLAERLRRHCETAGQDPQACTLLVFGGGGAALAVGLAEDLGCARAVLPMHPAAFSAWGLLQAELRFTQSLQRQHGDEAQAVFARLQARLLRQVSAEGLAPEDLRFERAQAQDAWHLSCSSAVPTPRLPIQPAARGPRPAPERHGSEGIDADRLLPGASFTGPARVVGAACGLELPAQAVLTVDSYGNLVIEWNPVRHLAPQRSGRAARRP